MQVVFSKVLPACQFGQRYPSPEMCIRLKVKVTKLCDTLPSHVAVTHQIWKSYLNESRSSMSILKTRSEVKITETQGLYATPTYPIS